MEGLEVDRRPGRGRPFPADTTSVEPDDESNSSTGEVATGRDIALAPNGRWTARTAQGGTVTVDDGGA